MNKNKRKWDGRKALKERRREKMKTIIAMVTLLATPWVFAQEAMKPAPPVISIFFGT